MCTVTIKSLDINPKLTSALASVTDLQTKAKVSYPDARLIKKEAAKSLYLRKPLTVKKVLLTNKIKTISTGSTDIDNLLNGGICNRGITEIYGESASAKTQLCLQLSLSVQLPPSKGGLARGTAYICTEDAFPTRRLTQMSAAFTSNHGPLPGGGQPCDNVYIQHIADVDQLIICLQHKVPMLCSQRKIGLIVLDSVAAPFRGKYSIRDTVARAKELSQIAAALFKLSHIFKIPVVCANQVTSNMADNSTPSPSLGLVWSNYVTSRLFLSRQCRPDGTTARSIEVVYSPWIPNGSAAFKVTETGVVDDDTSVSL